MAEQQPLPISPTELHRRRRLVNGIAEQLGFVGLVEYVHVFSQSGGAEFGLGTTQKLDRLTVTAEAFLRDSNPADFSLTAILAHERGHQLVFRHPTLSRWLRNELPVASEEVLASVIGSLLVSDVDDHNHLLLKAMHDAWRFGMDRSKVEHFVLNLRSILEAII